MRTNVSTILARSAAAFPAKTAIVAGDSELDYATLDTFARMFAGALGDLTAPEGVDNLTAVVAVAQPVDEPHPSAADDTAVVLYTSGTTGLPA